MLGYQGAAYRADQLTIIEIIGVSSPKIGMDPGREYRKLDARKLGCLCIRFSNPCVYNLGRQAVARRCPIVCAVPPAVFGTPD